MGSQFNRDPYFNQKRARAVLFGVLMLHVGVIAVPLIYSSLTDFFQDPQPIVMKVGIADLPLGDSPDAGAPADASAEVSEPDPVVSVDDIPNPQQVADLPPDLPPDPPKIETPPKPKDDPKTTVKPPEVKPKDPPKPTVKPKDPPKQTKTETKDPPKSTLLKPEDIIKPKNTKTQAQIDADRRAREAAEARAKAEAEARQRALADLRAAASGTQQGSYGTTNPGQDGILATAEMRAYYAQLVAFIRPKWNNVSPSSVELGGGNIANWPSIDLTISKKGEVTKAVFVSQSGNRKIDDAVKLLLADLKSVPVPPQAGTIRVTLDIR